MHCEIKHPDRLLRLAALLERDAANPDGVKFDLGFWAAPAEKPMAGYASEEVKPTIDCGTKACALGLAALSGEFAAEGLSYKFWASPGFNSYLMMPTMPDPNASWDSDTSNVDGMEAGAALFGIPHQAACYLFDPDYYDDTPQGAEGELGVAARIRQFAQDGFYLSEPDRGEDDYEDDYEDRADND